MLPWLRERAQVKRSVRVRGDATEVSAFLQSADVARSFTLQAGASRTLIMQTNSRVGRDLRLSSGSEETAVEIRDSEIEQNVIKIFITITSLPERWRIVFSVRRMNLKQLYKQLYWKV